MEAKLLELTGGGGKLVARREGGKIRNSFLGHWGEETQLEVNPRAQAEELS